MTAPSRSPSAPTVKRETLAATPARAFKLLHGIGTSRAIDEALARRGFTADERAEGWRLLQASSGYGKPSASEPDQVDTGVRSAIRALAAWDEDGLRIIRATLERRFPLQAARVLAGLSPSSGAWAVVNVGHLLERLDALAASQDETDRAAIALLAQRGITSEERARLRAHVDTAVSGGTEPAERARSETTESDATDPEQGLRDLRAWFEEWSAIAKSVVKRRDQLIVIGLAKKRGYGNERRLTRLTPQPAAPRE